MREALNGRPAKERTRREYQRVIDAYRRVYFGSPASSKADPSVVATAELLVEMGRRFDDNKILRGAIEEYKFLRKEYPGSKYRFDALFTIGEIYKDDLNDPEQSRKTFEDFLHRYPRNRLADDARAAVKEIKDQTQGEKSAARKTKPQPAAPQQTQKEAASAASDAETGQDDQQRDELPRVTGVRHWSTPDYTRVAIDVEQEIKFSSQRLSRPDRIFFDLRDTKLASTLVGKTFDVDDGFLTKIRVAEFKPGQTRIVLDVDDLGSYDAFLLPNPYRLIIDIHGKQTRASVLAKDRAVEEKKAIAQLDGVSSSGTGDVTDPDPKGKKINEKEHAVVSKAESAGDSTDDEDETSFGNDSSAAASGSKQGGGIVKTTVVVKGTDRRIPKTIVSPDDDVSQAKSTNRKKHGSSAGIDASREIKEAAATLDTKKNKGREGLSRDAEASTDDSPIEVAKTASTGDAIRASAREKSLRNKKSQGTTTTASDTSDLETREARPTARGDRSLTRALGLKIGKIVIDAGHGGHDTGTIGPNGLREKDVVLDVAKRLGRLLETRLGAEVVYTRRDDTFIPLETRTAIANRERADLFISIHANSSRDEDARGVETYYLNFTSSPEALEVAARENAVSEKSIHELQDLVKKIALREKIDESREFASDVQDSLFGGLSLSNAGLRNRGVKKAPFIVLIGANMPSILAEISFVSNPTDERKLGTAEHRQRIAEALYRGVSKYTSGLSGVKVASKIDRTEAQ